MKKLSKKVVSLGLVCLLAATTVACSPKQSTSGSDTQAQPQTSAIAQASLRDSADATVSYLGPEGTYTEQATQCFFPKASKLTPKKTVPDAIADVTSGAVRYAVIPQENTIGGVVTDYVDALIDEQGVSVVGEVVLPINQTLMGVEGASLDNIKVVCSHAQGIAQSEDWRAQHLPDAQTQEMDSTAAAASHVAETGDPTIAAVAAPGAAKIYGLKVLAENVQITDANKTSFYVLSKTPLQEEGQTHAAFVADCDASAIDDVIVSLHEAGLELVTIHDRPEGSKLGSYHYVVEVENKDGITQKQLDEIKALLGVRCLGTFDVVEAK